MNPPITLGKMRLNSCIPTMSAASHAGLSQRRCETNGNTPVLSFRFRHKDGTYRILEGRGNNLMNDPAVAGIVFNSRDVTEKRRLEEQFQQSQKVQAIGQLTGGVAHDFNNILTAIYIGLQRPHALQQISPWNPSRRRPQISTEISKAAHRAAAFSPRQLLAFSRKQGASAPGHRILEGRS